MKYSSKLQIMEHIFHSDCSLESPRKIFNILFMGSVIVTPTNSKNSKNSKNHWSIRYTLNLWGWHTGPFTIKIYQQLLSLMSPATRYAWIKHTICYHAILPPLPSHVSPLTWQCPCALLLVWRKHCIFLFSLGTSSLTFLCILYFPPL